jgi:hypothetical protein
MTPRMLRLMPAVLAGLAFLLAPATVSTQEKPKASAPDGTVAMIGGKPISDTELEEIGKDKLARIKAEELNLKRQILEEYIVKRLLDDGQTVCCVPKACSARGGERALAPRGPLPELRQVFEVKPEAWRSPLRTASLERKMPSTMASTGKPSREQEVAS